MKWNYDMIHKIEIDWDFRSPSLQALTGIVRIDQMDYGLINPKENPGFPVKKVPGQRGYKDCPAIFTRCKPLVDVMVDAYFDGMRLADQSFVWFDGCSRHNNDVTIHMKD